MTARLATGAVAELWQVGGTIMTMKIVASAVALFLVLAVLHLGMRLHSLEHRIDTLEHGSKSPTQVVAAPPQHTEPNEWVPASSLPQVEGKLKSRTQPLHSKVGVP